MGLLFWILTLSILAGQLIKIPFSNQGGMTLLDLVIIIYCLIGLWRLKLRLKAPPLFITASFYFILADLVSLLMTPIHLEPLQLLNSFSYTIRFFIFILFGWLIYSGAFAQLKKNIHEVLLFSGVAFAILGLLQFLFLPDLSFLEKSGWDPHYFRTASTFLDPNFLGSYLVLTLILLASITSLSLRGTFMLTERTVAIYKFKLPQPLKVLVMTTIYIALMTTFSRGAYLAFLISFTTLSILHKSAKLGIITILLFLTLMLGFTTYQKLVAQPRGIDRTQSAEFRFNAWQQGWQIFQANPLLGVGFNTYRYALKQYNLGDEQFLKSHGSSTNDSSLLYVTATTGIIGLLSYLFFLGSILFTAFAHSNNLPAHSSLSLRAHPSESKTGRQGRTKKINYPLVAGLMGLIIQSFFANTLFYPPLLLWLILMAI